MRGLLLAAVGLVSCVRVPAYVSAEQRPAPELAPPAEAPAPVIVEAAIATPGRALGPGTLATLYGCFFDKPYPYMFARRPGGVVRIGGRPFGSFEAGISGIMHYGSLSECAAELTGTPKRSYSDDRPMAALAGLPLFSSEMVDDSPFGFYNPELVRWGHAYLLPEPNSVIEGVAAQQIYDHVFQRFFHAMTESYLDLRATGRYAQEQDEYWQMAVGKQVNGIDWLTQRYGGRLSHLDRAANGTSMSMPMAYGFWLRRGIDGTEPELWIGLRKLLERYDGAYYRALAGRYQAAGVAW